jgi:hypothetical protein
MYREYFDELDTNKDGTIGLKEFKTLMASLKMPASQSTAAVSLKLTIEPIYLFDIKFIHSFYFSLKNLMKAKMVKLILMSL